jgi:ParB/RepB/Spo0J family partition protein
MTAALTPDIRSIPLVQLHESPMNTRQHFDEHKLSELAASMATTGQLTPILARPSTLPKKDGFEIAAGHRRRRAAERAGLDSLMVIVRDLDDRTFLEILTIENLQREDVHPLEEAQGYRNLLTIDAYDPKQIADRVGKSESYVYDRLKLLQLAPELQELFFANRFSLGHAILLARIPKDDQLLAIAPNGSGRREGGLWRGEGAAHPTLDIPADDENDPYSGLVPRSARELQAWIDTYVRFDPRDEAVPQLFPSTAATLTAAAAARMKVLPITRNYHIDPEAKDPEGKRTFGPTSWKRADGQVDADRFGNEKPSEVCDYSVVGLIAVGEGRGESFRVCVDKKRCTTHWAAEIKARNQRERAKEKGDASPSTGKSSKPAESSWERDNRLREERQKLAETRWAKGGDAVLRAIAPLVKKLAVGGKTPATKYFLEEIIEDGIYGVRDTGKTAEKLGVPFGSSAAELIRHLIMVALIDRADPGKYNATSEADLQEDLDELKIKVDVAKLLDAANPTPKPEPKKGAKARMRRRRPRRSPQEARGEEGEGQSARDCLPHDTRKEAGAASTDRSPTGDRSPDRPSRPSAPFVARVLRLRRDVGDQRQQRRRPGAARRARGAVRRDHQALHAGRARALSADVRRSRRRARRDVR